MTSPYDMQADVVREMGELLADPCLTADELALVVVTLERFVHSGLVTQTEAGAMLADRTWRPS
jgi:hypothetical protein